MSKSNVTLYGFSFSHHGRFSSFRRLLHYASDCRTMDVTIPFATFLNSKLAGRLERNWQRMSEWRLRPIFSKKQRQCVHYLYPENSFFRGGKWKGRHGIVISCHQPPGFFGVGDDTYILDALRCADRVVLLTETFRSGYERLCDKDKLRVILHGVDVHFFTPSEKSKKRPLVITVGNWLRDYDFWAKAVSRLAMQMPEVHFAVVAMPNVVSEPYIRMKAQLGERVQFLHGLSDAALRELYQEATLLFLPLKDAGANNALLEAMSSGLPVLVSDLPATREYAGDAAMFFSQGDLEECVRKLGNLLTDADVRARLAASSRKRAVEQFSWEIIAGQYERLYAEVLED